MSDAAGYPPHVTTAEEKRRWDLCVQAAEALFADLDAGERSSSGPELVWQRHALAPCPLE